MLVESTMYWYGHPGTHRPQRTEVGIAMTGEHEIAEAAGDGRTFDATDALAKRLRVVVVQDGHLKMKSRYFKPADDAVEGGEVLLRGVRCHSCL